MALKSAYWLSVSRSNQEVNLWAKQWAQVVKDRVRQKVSGEVLQKRTGRLYRSIRVIGNQYGFTVRGEPYGMALDRGFIRKAYTVVPKIKNYLKFVAKSGDTVYATRVNIPKTVFEPKPAFSEAWNELLPTMSQDLQRRLGGLASNAVRETLIEHQRRFTIDIKL